MAILDFTDVKKHDGEKVRREGKEGRGPGSIFYVDNSDHNSDHDNIGHNLFLLELSFQKQTLWVGRYTS